MTFAEYLARYYTGRKGFEPVAVPEAAALAQACDIVLTRHDGVSIQMVCIVDREANPRKAFGMAPDALRQIGEKCLKYSGTVSGQKMPVVIHVIEVAAGPATDEERARLAALRRASPFAKVQPMAWRLDTSSRSLWTNAPLGGWLAGGAALRKRSPTTSFP